MRLGSDSVPLFSRRGETPSRFYPANRYESGPESTPSCAFCTYMTQYPSIEKSTSLADIGGIPYPGSFRPSSTAYISTNFRLAWRKPSGKTSCHQLSISPQYTRERRLNPFDGIKDDDIVYNAHILRNSQQEIACSEIYAKSRMNINKTHARYIIQLK